MINALALGLSLAYREVDRMWRIETPGQPAFSVRLPAAWRPDWQLGRAGRRKKGVKTTPFFAAPDGRRLVVDFVPNASPEERKGAYDESFVNVDETARIVGRRFVRGRWTGVAVGITPTGRRRTAAFPRATQATMNVIMSDGKAVQMVCIAGPEGGALPSEAFAIRICETLGPVAKR